MANSTEAGNYRDPSITQLYFCATMWHETKQEMLMLLKSVLRMDFDHFKKKIDQAHSDQYNFETHIFFDDAYEDHKEGQTEYRVNEYVRQLVEAVPLSVRDFFSKINIEIKDPIKIPTPYGGRLEWKLPSGNMMIAHLKDKAKIRHKKRWSQVMYMYYLLGEKLLNNESFKDDKEKIKAAMNTYILALDGDVDFKPEAVHLLVDMMKKDPSVGAACGRIHPLGSGPIVWYQKFEYAIAHWLQKATEHVLGCVLCSPGCFSLFRAEALMSDNVMAKYATTSTKAVHYLQYDQGEDRWLCTLLLQAGYKVEYNAASDALTFAPEGFDEFFNQRRRWGPSTMANILDLVMDWWNVIRINKHMSLLYVLYHGTQFFASLVGPGTIFLMITGALQLALQPLWGQQIWPAFFLNLIPIAFFTAVSFFVESKTQLKMAKVYTVFYGLVMCMVIISVIIELASSYCSPSAVFFYIVTGSFLVSALLHPQECLAVVYGLVYFILIPCMYMLLIIYSFVNINNVSWGTREVVPTPSEQKANAEKQAEEREKQNKGVFGFITSIWSSNLGTRNNADDDDERNAVNCGSTCRVVCCPRSKKERKNEEYWQINKKLDQLQKTVYDALLKGNPREEKESITSSDDDDDDYNELESRDMFASDLTHASVKPGILRKRTTSQSKTNVTRNDMVNPFWIEEERLGSGAIQFIDEKENGFWKAFIDKYLKPLDNNQANKEKVEQQLLELRQNVNFGFILLNTAFIVIIMTLQANTEYLSVEWFCKSGKTGGNDMKVEPLGLMFLIYFMFILGLQFIGMIFHRLGTFWHILASTSVKDATDDSTRLVEEIINLTVEGDEESETDDRESLYSSTDGGADTFRRETALRKSFKTTKKLLERSLTIATPVTTLQEVLQPSIREFNERINDQDFKRMVTKMTQKERRKTFKQIAHSNGIQRRDRTFSDNTDTRI